MPDVQVRLRIRGQVQGVSFRYHAGRRARSLGLAGWVRNCPDGSVEAVVRGAAAAVDQFVAWAHRGPASARVEQVEVARQPLDGSMADFRIVG